MMRYFFCQEQGLWFCQGLTDTVLGLPFGVIESPLGSVLVISSSTP